MPSVSLVSVFYPQAITCDILLTAKSYMLQEWEGKDYVKMILETAERTEYCQKLL